MSKVTLNNVSNIASWTSAGSTIDSNTATIETAFDNTLSRDGTSPNEMNADLDMNSNDIINLPYPSTASSPIRLQDASLFAGPPGPTGPTGPTGSAGFIGAYDTKALAAAANIPSSLTYVTTAGYSTVGDGGGATYAKVNAFTAGFDFYSFTDGGGHKWQYVPEPTGFNAKVAGVVADGITNDSIHMMDALLPFQNPVIVPGGGNVTGTLLLPAANISLHSPIIITGTFSTSIKLLGQSVGNQGGASTTFKWGGSGTYPSMVIVYSANEFQMEGVNFDGQTGSGLVNCCHVTSDNMLVAPGGGQITISSIDGGGAPGTRTITCSADISGTGTAGLKVGASVALGIGTANFEIVYVASIGAAVPTLTNTFTAVTVNNHVPGDDVGYVNSVTNGVTFKYCTFAPPGPFVNNRECGIFVGNFITNSVQAAQVVLNGCNFVGGAFFHRVTISNGSPAVITDTGNNLQNGTAVQLTVGGGSTLNTGLWSTLTYYIINNNGTTYNLSLTSGGAAVNTSDAGSGADKFAIVQSYTGLRTVVGGNIKNYFMNNCVFQHCQYGIGGESLAGSVEILYPTFAGNFVADILAQGASNINITSGESETSGCKYLLGTSGGLNAAGATLVQNSYQCGLPADLYAIEWTGNLILESNTFFSQASSGPTQNVCPRIKNGAISTAAAATNLSPAGTVSIGNYYMFGGPGVSVFYDGSNNPMDYGSSVVDKEWRLLQVNDYGDNGPFKQKIGDISSIHASIDNSGISAGITNNNYGLMGYAQQSYTIPYTAFSAAGTGKTLTLLTLSAHALITGLVIDVTTGFTGSGITTSVVAGTATTATNYLLKTFNSSAQFVSGLATGDLNTGLVPTTAPSPLGYIFQSSPGVTGYTQWAGTSGGDTVTITMTSSGGNLNALTAGSMTVYVTYLKFR